MAWFTTFVNCRLCIAGALIEDQQFVTSDETGLILKRTGYIGGECVDLEGNIIAPGFLELQTNGVAGFHFTHFEDEGQYRQGLERVAEWYVGKGVTGFWATVPTVSPETFKKILPSLKPQIFSPSSASLLGAHAEGPYLEPSKKGAHNASLFQQPSTDPSHIYGAENLSNTKLVTLAPDLPDSASLIRTLRSQSSTPPVISLGHSNATYAQGLAALEAGATSLTHVFNAMPPLHHRSPGLAGLISLPVDKAPYYGVIGDGLHVDPALLSLAYRANPTKCVLVSDSIELAGMPDGTYPGHAQIPHDQVKEGDKVVIKGTETLIGAAVTVDDCVRNLMKASGCTVAEAVRCVTENVADMMGEKERGKLEEGRRADFVVLNDEGEVLQTWIAGVMVWEREGGLLG